MPIVSYYNSEHAWYFISILHRLAFKPDGIFTLASKSKSPLTIRLRLFNARRFIVETKRPEFNRYENLANSTRIKSELDKKRILLEKTEYFDDIYNAHVRNPPIFDRICRDALYFVGDGTKSIYELGGIDMSEPQVCGLRSYFQLIPAIRQAIVEQNLVILRK